ncbi:caspase family protein [Streptosporangium sp. NPDC049248]|uniref:caspase, EACC1-associated type n=1 Tax=Streptosporangium sp. NPDC049248 TaxID=3155651 RepID=UPI00341CCC64
MSLLSHEGTRVLIVGSGDYVPGSRLSPVPASRTTVADLGDCLVDRAGLDPARLTRCVDPADPQHFAGLLDDAARQATEVLVFYYVGHGLVSPANELHLATRATTDLTVGTPPEYQALPYSTVQRLLLRSTARLVLVVLDCCFSGRAHGVSGSAADDAFTVTRQAGAYLLTSTSRTETAWAPVGQPHTAFSGELIRLLTEGEPTGPPGLTLDYVYRFLARSLPDKGLPQPRRQAADLGDQEVLAPNPAYRPPQAPATPEPWPADDTESPYRGLASFGPQDSAFFFGREELTHTLLERLRAQQRTGGPLLVTGPSGAGKSSLLRAGLIAALPTASPRVYLTPGSDPMGKLGRLVPETTPERRPVVVVDQFEEVFTACQDEEQRLAFIRALAALCEAGNGTPPAAAVVIGLRADFFGHCAAYPELLDATKRPEIVPPMGEDQLRDVIERPATLAGLTIQPGLVDLLLEDLGIGRASSEAASGPGGGLPLLSHALLTTWQRRQDGVLTFAGYRASGGIAQSLAQTADTVMRVVGPSGELIAREMLLHLVRLGDGTDDTRRRVLIDDVLPEPDDPEYPVTRRVLDTFLQARLVIVDEDSVQLTHEALIRGWPQLQGWITADRARLLVRQRLSEDAETWRRQSRDPAYLYVDNRLVAAQEAVGSGRQSELGPLQHAFLAASVSRARRRSRITLSVIVTLAMLLVAAVGAGGYALRQSAVAREQSRIADDQRDLATGQRDAAISRQVSDAVERLNDTSLSGQLALAAYNLSDTPEARGAMVDSLGYTIGARLLGHSGFTGTVAISPGGRLVASGSADRTARIWDVGDLTRPAQLAVLEGHGKGVSSVAFDRSGSLLATGSADDTVRLWDIGDPRHPALTATVHRRESAVSEVAFDPAADVLAIAFADGAIELWDTSTPGTPSRLAELTGHEKQVESIDFSADGNVLASSSEDQTVRLWDTGDKRRPSFLGGVRVHPGGALHAVKFSPDRKILAVAYDDNTAKLWDVSDLSRAPLDGATLQGAVAPVSDLAFSPDGRTLAVSSTDNSITLWKVKDYAHVSQRQVLIGHGESVQSVAYSPDGRFLASAAADQSVRLWDVHDPDRVEFQPKLESHKDLVYGVDVAADGRTMASVAADSTVKLWDIRDFSHPTLLSTTKAGDVYLLDVKFSPDGHTLASTVRNEIWLWDITAPAKPVKLAALKGHTKTVMAVAFSPDGRTLVSGAEDDTTRVWDVRSPARPKVLTVIRKHSDSVLDVAFTSDGSLLATASGDRTVRLWDMSDPAHPDERGVIEGHSALVDTVDFSANGDLLATGAGDGTARIWDVRDPGRPIPSGILKGHTDLVWDVEFSPDGRSVVTGAGDSVTRLWDVSDPARPILTTILGLHSSRVAALTFTPDGRGLVTGSHDNSVRLRVIDIPTVVKRICDTTGMALTREEWGLYIPDIGYRPPCPAR